MRTRPPPLTRADWLAHGGPAPRKRPVLVETMHSPQAARILAGVFYRNDVLLRAAETKEASS